MVASLADFETLSLEGLEIDTVSLKVAQLSADFGDGFGAEAAVGSASGLWGWEIMSDCLPDNTSYANLINGKPRFQYYSDFFLDHTVGTSNPIFVIDFRGKKYHASFDTKSISGAMHSYDLFGLEGVKLKMRRVPDIYYNADGSLFIPGDLTEVWGWYMADDLTIDNSASGHDLNSHGNIVDTGGTAVNGFVSSRFNGGSTNTGYLNTALDPTIYEAFFAIKINEATFSTYGGILTADATTGALVGNLGDTKLNNFTFGGTYSYKKNAVTFTEANQQAPMNVFGVMHAKWSGGILMTNLQIGKDRAATDRYLEADIAEIVLCNAALSATNSSSMDAYLMRKYDIA